MITIKTGKTEIKHDGKGIASAVYAMEAINIKFSDGIDISIPHDGDNSRLNVALNMLKNSQVPNKTFDLTKKDNPLSLNN